ncbi:MAG: type II toxin-antitoxin system HicB family antitoxin [Patescibacteria group bacterium]
MFHFHAIFRAEPKGGYTAIVPSLPGCVSYGKTLAEAQRMIKDAIEVYVMSLMKHGEVVPTDDLSFVASIHIEEARSQRKTRAYASKATA